MNKRMVEDCQLCGHKTEHTVRIELRTESTRDRNTEFSREPYRVTTCQACGMEDALRMNDA